MKVDGPPLHYISKEGSSFHVASFCSWESWLLRLDALMVPRWLLKLSLEKLVLLWLFRHSVVFDSMQSHGLQHTRLPCPSPSPETCSNSCPLSRWCHPTISSSVVPFSSRLQSFLASGSFPMALHTRWPKYWSIFSYKITRSSWREGTGELLFFGYRSSV